MASLDSYPKQHWLWMNVQNIKEFKIVNNQLQVAKNRTHTYSLVWFAEQSEKKLAYSKS